MSRALRGNECAWKVAEHTHLASIEQEAWFHIFFLRLLPQGFYIFCGAVDDELLTLGSKRLYSDRPLLTPTEDTVF